MAKHSYKRISLKDRENIEKMLKCGHSVSDIAKFLGKARSSIHMEIKRCQNLGQYNAKFAHEDYQKNNNNKSKSAILKLDKKLSEYISKMILEDSLSVVKIINRLKSEDYPNSPTSPRTIYTAIDNGLIPNVTRETLLLNRKKTHMFSNGLIKIPKWIRDELGLKDNQDLTIDIVGQKIIIQKNEG